MAYQWSPDYSSFIDTSKYPNAQWMPFDAGGGSEGSQFRSAGWYTPGGYDSSGTEGRYVSPELVDDGRRSYWDLKNAGLWNLQDPNSESWKYLQASSGGNYGDVRSDPNALFRGLLNSGLGQAATSRDDSGRQQVEGAYREALTGLNPEFIDKFVPAVGGLTEGYWTASKQHEGQGAWKDIDDVAITYKDMVLENPALMAALIAITGGAAAGAMGGAGAGAAEGGAVAGGTAGASAGGGFGATVGAGLNGLASPLVDLGLSQGAANAAVIGGGLGAGKTALAGGNFSDVLKGGAMGAVGGGAGSAVFGGTGGTAGMPVGPDGMPMGGSFGSTTGGGMDFLDGLGDPLGGFTTDPSLADLQWGGDGAGMYSGDIFGPNEMFRDPFDGLFDPSNTYQNPDPMNMPLPNGGITGGYGFTDMLREYGNSGLAGLKALLAKGGASTGGTGPGGSYGLDDLKKALGLGGGASTGDLLLGSAPALAAILYAKNQGGFDTSRLTDTYDQFQPSAMAYQYDQNTAAGRQGLESSLASRGVMGSSFGNMDMTNFQTSRDLGRQSLINQGLAQRGQIANSILDAQVKERALKNQLYGSALYSIGNVFGGRR